MKNFLIASIALIISAAGCESLPKGGNLGDTAEMKAANKSLSAIQNKYGPIVFVSGKADIDIAKCKKTMDVVVTTIKQYPRFLITVEGHTDNVGNAKLNKDLSQKRAQAVVNWLVTNGKVNKNQLKALGLGDTKPIADNKTEKGRAKNRRVDFQVSKL